MILSELRQVTRAIIPGCKSDVVNDTLLDILLNEGVKDITAYCDLLPTNKKFDAVASKGDISNPYLLSSSIGNYLSMGRGGLWWNEGDNTTPKWKKLNPRTVEWLDENRPNWHEIADGTPEEYAIDGNNLYVVPAPVSSLTTGLWLFYNATPNKMTTTSQYPFSGTTVEYTQFSIFDFAIIYFARWKIIPMLGKDSMNDDFNRNQNLYIKERAEKLGLSRRRGDIAQVVTFRGPNIR
jgi:hypothetical protein